MSSADFFNFHFTDREQLAWWLPRSGPMFLNQGSARNRGVYRQTCKSTVKILHTFLSKYRGNFCSAIEWSPCATNCLFCFLRVPRDMKITVWFSPWKKGWETLVWTKESVFDSRRWKFLSSQSPRLAVWPIQSPVRCIPGGHISRAQSSRGTKLTTLSYSAEVENAWSYTSTFHTCL
jgi:hypothetical protein